MLVSLLFAKNVGACLFSNQVGVVVATRIRFTGAKSYICVKLLQLTAQKKCNSSDNILLALERKAVYFSMQSQKAYRLTIAGK